MTRQNVKNFLLVANLNKQTIILTKEIGCDRSILSTSLHTNVPPELMYFNESELRIRDVFYLFTYKA